MSRRYGLRDDQWEKVKALLPGREETVGVTAKDNRLFGETVLYRYRATVGSQRSVNTMFLVNGLAAPEASAAPHPRRQMVRPRAQNVVQYHRLLNQFPIKFINLIVAQESFPWLVRVVPLHYLDKGTCGRTSFVR